MWSGRVELLTWLTLIGSVTMTRAADIEVPSVILRVIEEVEVPARDVGAIAEVLVREGQSVAKGDLLARIEDTESELTRQQAKVELEIAQTNSKNNIHIRLAKKALEVARAELQRAHESQEKFPKSVSQTQMDRLTLLVQRSELDVEQAQHELVITAFTKQLKEIQYQLADHQVQRRRMTAPFGGVVVEIHGRRGEWVESGHKVLRMLRIDRLRAEGFISAGELVRDRTDSRVTLTADLPGEKGAKFSGKLVFVSPEIDPVNRQVRVWAEIENRGLRLRPGLPARMTINRGPTATSPR